MFQKLIKHLSGGTLSEIYRESKWIYSQMRGYKRVILAYVLLGLTSTALSLLIALVSKDLINTIVRLGGSGSGGLRVVRLGMTVVLRHEDGYVTTYSSLAAEISVKPGDAVKLGQKLGAVGDTALLECAIGEHVHFAVTRNDEPVDPAQFLKQAH